MIPTDDVDFDSIISENVSSVKLKQATKHFIYCFYLDFVRLKELISRSTGGSGLRPKIFDLSPAPALLNSPTLEGRGASHKLPPACPDSSGNWGPGGECNYQKPSFFRIDTMSN